MKKLVTLLSLIIVATTLFAQKGKVTSALSYSESGDLEKAYETIMVALDPENEKAAKSIIWPRAWTAKGEILQKIFSLKKTGIVDEPLFKAYDAYQKAIELDTKSKFSKSIVVDLTFLQTDLSNCAIQAYEKEQYDVALECFEKFMSLSNNSLMNHGTEEVVDTAIIYNAGLTAFKSNNWDKAIKYFKRSAELDYNGDASYQFAFESYQAKGDTLKSIELLKEGFEKYPESETLIVQLINYYISTGNSEDAITYIDFAIKEKPDNVSLYTAKGATYEKLGKQEEAIDVYKKSIIIDSTQFTPYYNLGVIYFNRGVNVLNEASQLPPSESDKYDAEIDKGKIHLKEALPYIEKAYSIDSTEVAIMESLRLIYYRLQMTDKYDVINEKIKSISK